MFKWFKVAPRKICFLHSTPLWVFADALAGWRTRLDLV